MSGQDTGQAESALHVPSTGRAEGSTRLPEETLQYLRNRLLRRRARRRGK